MSKVIFTTSIFLVFFFIGSTSRYALAQSGSPVQPEYTSYQEPGSSELVNTLTGDMSLNIPVLEVPSPEGGYSIPLFYNAGIGLEQDASWVGLGWNINVGAIQRSIVQFPDDANGQTKSVENFDQILTTSQPLEDLDPLYTGYDFADIQNSTKRKGWFKKEVTYFIDQTRDDKMYGILNLHNIPISDGDPNLITDAEGGGTENVRYYYDSNNPNEGGVGDFHMDFDGSDYVYDSDAISPLSMAKDAFSVMAPGISGSLEAVRLETASATIPRDLSIDHVRLALSKYKDYKLQFRYKGLLSNRYYHHVGKDQNGDRDLVNPIYGLSTENNVSDLTIRKSDATLVTERFEPGRQGLSSDYLDQAIDVKWYTNAELNQSDASITFDYLGHETSRQNFRNGLINNNHTGMADQIGAFVITAVDGSRYYFTLPVYEYDQYSRIEASTDNDKYTEVERSPKFASTWLLTAIVGSNFIDRNNNHKVDDEDLGRWVKFEYGKFSDSFNWRYPYEFETSKLSPDGQAKSYQQGKREQYYLDAIHTRTHSALFIKAPRTDGRGAFMRPSPGADPIASSSARLHEIIVVSKQDLESSQQLSPPFAKVNANNNNFSNNTFVQSVLTGDRFDEIYDTEDIQGSVGDFLRTKSISSVRFHSSYELAKGVPSSFEHFNIIQYNNLIITSNPYQGKLTLDSLEFFGIGGASTYNQYRFFYEFNPAYGRGNWDAWGMYHSKGHVDDLFSHVSNDKYEGSAWSLTTMSAPSGVVTKFNYERDDYGFVSGEDAKESVSFKDSDWGNGIHLNDNFNFIVGDIVEIVATVEYDKKILGQGYESEVVNRTVTDVEITGVYANTILIDKRYTKSELGLQSGDIIHKVSGNVQLSGRKLGGNLRVTEIEIYDNSDQPVSTVYGYNDELLSTGHITREPYYVKGKKYDWQDYYDYPQTSVLYEKVSVLSGIDPVNGNYDSETTYYYQMPDQNTVEVNEDIMPEQPLNIGGQLQRANFVVKSNAAKIGRIDSIQSKDGQGNILNRQLFDYIDQSSDDLGVYSEGTLLTERLTDDQANVFYRVFRTTKLYYPNILKSSTTINREGVATTTINKEWDFITGNVTVSESTTANGYTFRSKSIPAYIKYPSMGPAGKLGAGRHFLAQNAATYNYKIENDQIQGLVNANVQEWSDQWETGRVPSGNYYYFEDINDDRFLPSRSLRYKGATEDLELDGTIGFDESDEYDFTSPNVTEWELLSNNVYYDSLSNLVESEDINGTSFSVKRNLRDLPLIEGSSAKYEEIVFSSFEDLVDALDHFPGEVKLVNGERVSVSSGLTHTGDFSIKSTASNKVFRYMTDSLIAGRTYRFMAWTTSINAKLVYKLNGGSSNLVYPDPAHKAGDWYLISATVEMPDPFTKVNVYVEGDGGTVYFDDFRIQPLESSAVAHVYDKAGREVCTLDNNNLFTQIEYDDQNRPIRGYQETFKSISGRVKVWEKEYYKGSNLQLIATVASGPEETCYSIQSATGSSSAYRFEWYVNEIENPVEVGFQYCTPLDCFRMLRLHVIDNTTDQTVKTYNYVGDGADLVWLNGNSNIRLESLNSSTNEGTFKVEWNGGNGPYTVKWFEDGILSAYKEVASGVYSAKATYGDRCGYTAHATVSDKCGLYTLVTNSKSVGDNVPNLRLSMEESPAGSKQFRAVASGGAAKSGLQDYTFSWKVNGQTRSGTPSGRLASTLDLSAEQCNFRVIVGVSDDCRNGKEVYYDWDAKPTPSGSLSVNPVAGQPNQYLAVLELSSDGVTNNGAYDDIVWTYGSGGSSSNNPTAPFTELITRGSNDCEALEVRVVLTDHCNSKVVTTDDIEDSCPPPDPCDDPCDPDCPNQCEAGCIAACPATCTTNPCLAGCPDPCGNSCPGATCCTPLVANASLSQTPAQAMATFTVNATGSGPFNAYVYMDGSTTPEASRTNQVSLSNETLQVAMVSQERSAEVVIEDNCGNDFRYNKKIDGLSEMFEVYISREVALRDELGLEVKIKSGYTAPYTIYTELTNVNGDVIDSDTYSNLTNSSFPRYYAFQRDCSPRTAKIVVSDGLVDPTTGLVTSYTFTRAVFASDDPVVVALDGPYATIGTGCTESDPGNGQNSNIVVSQLGVGGPDQTIPPDEMPEARWYYRCDGLDCIDSVNPSDSISYYDPGINWVQITACDGYGCCEAADLPADLPPGVYDIKFSNTSPWSNDGYLFQFEKLDSLNLD